jgi:NAD(P)H-flavin reductase
LDNLYEPQQAVVEKIVTESPTIKTFVLRPKGRFEFRAGQFIELTMPGIGESPFTPSSSPYHTETVDVTVMRVGWNTRALHAVQPGSPVGIRGPLGTPYPLDVFAGREVFIVGGGVGLAPLRSLLLALLDDADRYKRIYLRYGARTAADRIYKPLLDEWAVDPRLDLVCTVDVGDDSWKGRVGVVTTILETPSLDVKSAVSVVCGPPIMLKFVTASLLKMGFAPESLYLSMEQNMSCGVGMCGHCRIGNYYICRDGPVFTYAQLKDVPEVFA